MKQFKTLVALVLAVMMTLALVGSAFADTKNDSITIKNAKPGETYEIYKLFTLEVDSETNPTAYSYKVAPEWASFFAAAEGSNPAGAGNQYITINDAGYVTAISDVAALAKAAAGAVTGKTQAATSVTVAEGASTAAFTGLADGYYLITSTLGTIAMTDTTPDKNAVEITEKNPEDTIEKEVKEDSTGTYGDSNDAQVGDTVEFKSTVRIVKGTRNVVVHDKMTSGLTFDTDSIAIAGLAATTNYTVNTNPTDGDTFDITFVQSWIDGLDFGTDSYKEYEITYTAKLNDAAVIKNADGVAIVDQTNKTHVSFGNDTDSQEDTTTTTTHKFAVYKHEGSKTENLAGAVFKVKKNGTALALIKLDDQNYRIAKSGETGTVETFTTIATSDIVIWGVDADTDYALEEITPPAGYNKLTQDVDVTVNANNSTRVDVENNKGSELPSTGGIGTTIFYVAGIVLVLGAAAVIIARRKAEQN